MRGRTSTQSHHSWIARRPRARASQQISWTSLQRLCSASSRSSSLPPPCWWTTLPSIGRRGRRGSTTSHMRGRRKRARRKGRRIPINRHTSIFLRIVDTRMAMVKRRNGAGQQHQQPHQPHQPHQQQQHQHQQHQRHQCQNQ